MKESERLRAAKALIEVPSTWLKGAYADNLNDLKKATCFCSLGAVLRIRGEGVGCADYNSTSRYLRVAVSMLSNFFDTACFNDSHTHAEVMAMWDLAIELAEKDEAR